MVLSTTIADTTFPAEIGKRYVWDFTAPPISIGNKLSFKAVQITQGISDTHESLLVYAKISQYIPSTGEWVDIVNSMFYIAANETQNYLHFNINWPMPISPLVIPTPINLPLVAEALHDAYFTQYTYSIDGNTIIFTNTPTTYEFTFNSGGFLTVETKTTDGELTDKIVLEGSGGTQPIVPQPGIPFGIYFLIPTVGCIVAIVIHIKRRQLRTK